MDIRTLPDFNWAAEEVPSLVGCGLELTLQAMRKVNEVLKKLFLKMHTWREANKNEAGYPPTGDVVRLKQREPITA